MADLLIVYPSVHPVSLAIEWHCTLMTFCGTDAPEYFVGFVRGRRIEWVLQLWSCHSMIWQTEHQLCILFNFQHSICRHIFSFFLYSSSFYVSDPLTDSPVHKNSPRLIPHPFAHSNQTSFRPSLLCHGKISCIMWLMCANRMPSSPLTRSWSPLPHLALLHSGGEEVRMNQDIFIKKAPLTTKKIDKAFPLDDAALVKSLLLLQNKLGLGWQPGRQIDRQTVIACWCQGHAFVYIPPPPC